MARASTCWAVSVAPNAIFFFFYLTAVDVAQHIRDLGFKPQHCLNRSGGGTRVSHVLQATRGGGEVGRLWFPVHPWLSQLEAYLCYTGPCLREKMHSDLFHLNILWPFPPWQPWLMTITSKACSAKRLACPSETQPIVGECLREGLDVSVDSGCVFLALSLGVFR